MHCPEEDHLEVETCSCIIVLQKWQKYVWMVSENNLAKKIYNLKLKKTKLGGFSPRVNRTDRAAAAGRRS